jgi:hypothetical protein
MGGRRHRHQLASRPPSGATSRRILPGEDFRVPSRRCCALCRRFACARFAAGRSAAVGPVLAHLDDMFDLRSLARPIVGAPMAVGPSTPALAAAISDSGGLDFLAAGYRTADQLADDLTATRELTSGPIGLNLFVVTANAPNPDYLAAYWSRRLGVMGVEVGVPLFDDGDWEAKVAVVLDLKPDIVTFTFGCPSAEAIAGLHRAGITTGAPAARPLSRRIEA